MANMAKALYLTARAGPMKLQLLFWAFVLSMASGFAIDHLPLSYGEVRGMKLSDSRPTGARVFAVTTGSSAANAGVLLEDVITEIDGKPVANVEECVSALAFANRKKGITLLIQRDGQQSPITLQIQPVLSYDWGFEPKPPVPFPAAYKDYQILPNTISPDNRYAFIFPKRSRLYDLKEYGLFLASLQPFHIVSKIPLGNSNLAGNARCYYASHWTKDSSAAVFIAGFKWGPEKVWVLRMRDGKTTKLSDLTAAVRQQVLPDFKKSHAEPYNDYYDFIFDSEDRQTVVDGETLAERGWDLDDTGHVIIDCACTTNPKPFFDPHRWAVRFKGVWDIQSGKFTAKEFTRMKPKSE
jgi:membrane-associated protease RseP (regulator of RpoE activity)